MFSCDKIVILRSSWLLATCQNGKVSEREASQSHIDEALATRKAIGGSFEVEVERVKVKTRGREQRFEEVGIVPHGRHVEESNAAMHQFDKPPEESPTRLSPSDIEVVPRTNITADLVRDLRALAKLKDELSKENATLVQQLKDQSKAMQKLAAETSHVKEQLKNKDKTMQELAAENTFLKDDNEELHKTLQAMQGVLDACSRLPRRKLKAIT